MTEIGYCPYGILTPNVLDAKIDALDLLEEEEMLGEALTRLLLNPEMLKKYSRGCKEASKRIRDRGERIMGVWGEYF